MKRGTRLSLNRALAALVRDIADRLPEFSHLEPSRILVVAGEARRASHASVRPLRFQGGKRRKGKREKPSVQIRGKRVLYVITLRPIWFRQSTVEQRVGTLLHELFHISTQFDGTLHVDRRHAEMGKGFAQALAPLVRRYLLLAPKAVLAPLAHEGLANVNVWLERPPASIPRPAPKSVRKIYTEAQLFLAPVRMLTRR